MQYRIPASTWRTLAILDPDGVRRKKDEHQGKIKHIDERRTFGGIIRLIMEVPALREKRFNEYSGQ